MVLERAADDLDLTVEVGFAVDFTRRRGQTPRGSQTARSRSVAVSAGPFPPSPCLDAPADSLDLRRLLVLCGLGFCAGPFFSRLGRFLRGQRLGNVLEPTIVTSSPSRIQTVPRPITTIQ
jgi:hypothetical protein